MPIPAPAADENAVAPYGIRYPKPTAKANTLATRFQKIAEDVSEALSTFGLPPVQVNQLAVANSAAARDAHFGNPGTATQRLALQNTGAQCVRVDMGWTEQYFAGLTDGGSNPVGATVAGWYPVAGKMPKARLTKTSAQSTHSTPNTPTAIAFDIEDYDVGNIAAGMHAPGNTTRITCPVAGVYQVTGRARFLSTTARSGIQLYKNGAFSTQSEAQNAGIASPGTNAMIEFNDTVKVSAGDYLEVFMNSDTASISLGLPQTVFAVTYIGPV